MKLKTPPKPKTTDQNTDKKQQSQVNPLVVGGMVMVIQAKMMQPNGLLTSSLKILMSFGGAICCLVGGKQDLDKLRQKK